MGGKYQVERRSMSVQVRNLCNKNAHGFLLKCLPKKHKMFAEKTESQRKLSSKKVMKQIREKENRWNRWMLPESEQ